MAAKTHVIELASPAFIRPRYVRRQGDDGGFVVTTHPQRARRYDPIMAAKALRSMQHAIESGGWTPAVVPAAALGEGAAS